jgi:hypothetical protein
MYVHVRLQIGPKKLKNGILLAFDFVLDFRKEIFERGSVQRRLPFTRGSILYNFLQTTSIRMKWNIFRKPVALSSLASKIVNVLYLKTTTS